MRKTNVLLALIVIVEILSIVTCDYAGIQTETETEPIEQESAVIDIFTPIVEIPKVEPVGNRDARKRNQDTIARSALIVPESTNAEAINTEPATTQPPSPETVAETQPPPPETAAETQPPEAVAETYIPETTTPVEPPTETAAPASATPVYSVNGQVLDENIQAFLYLELAKYGIEWFMPYAILIAYQESQFNPTIINQQNGIDMGLFQFRVYYYPGSNIFDPYEQTTIFCQLMANRANAGLSVYEMISRHNTSDYGVYNPQYVAEVMRHEGGLCRIR